MLEKKWKFMFIFENKVIKHSMTRMSYLVLIVFMLISCNGKEKEAQKADEHLDYVEELIDQNSYNAAKIQIDSIHILYPRLIDKRRKAASLSDTIARRESARTLVFCDTALIRKNKELEHLLVNFRLEKDKKYQTIGSYVYKSQVTEANTGRNYLKAYVDENADFYLVSNYTGRKIEHTALKVNVGDLYAGTDTLSTSSPAYHSFTDDGTRWETLSLKNEAAKAIAMFVAQYLDSNIKVTLIGANSTSQYQLTTMDKNALAATYALWIIKKDIVQLQLEIKKAKARIYRINHNTIKK
jgi:hypothetical protein